MKHSTFAVAVGLAIVSASMIDVGMRIQRARTTVAAKPVTITVTNTVRHADNWRVVQTTNGLYWIEGARWERLPSSLTHLDVARECVGRYNNEVEYGLRPPDISVCASNGFVNARDMAKAIKDVNAWTPPYKVIE